MPGRDTEVSAEQRVEELEQRLAIAERNLADHEHAIGYLKQDMERLWKLFENKG